VGENRGSSDHCSHIPTTRNEPRLGSFAGCGCKRPIFLPPPCRVLIASGPGRQTRYQRIWVGTARGSSSRGARKAVLQLARDMGAGHPAGFTVDGPRGPARVAQPGAVWLAKATGNLVLRSISKRRAIRRCGTGTARKFPSHSPWWALRSVSRFTCRPMRTKRRWNRHARTLMRASARWSPARRPWRPRGPESAPGQARERSRLGCQVFIPS